MAIQYPPRWSEATPMATVHAREPGAMWTWKGGGGMAVFVFGTRLLSSTIHSCTHTGAYKQIQAYLRPPRHMHLIWTTARALALGYMNIYTLPNTCCNKGCRKYPIISSVQIWRVCVFFPPNAQWTYWFFFPLNCPEAFAYCIFSSSPVCIQVHCYYGFWEWFQRWWSTLEICFSAQFFRAHFPC